VYTSYASRLPWGPYFSLVRKLLYKIEKAQRKVYSVAAQKQDSTQEKTITKCLCKVLDGFNIEGVPDAVDLIKGEIDGKWKQRKEDVVEYSDFLKDFVGDALDSEPESDFDSDHEDVED
jgi:hypothetical protein